MFARSEDEMSWALNYPVSCSLSAYHLTEYIILMELPE